jgi:hypothetical protein
VRKRHPSDEELLSRLLEVREELRDLKDYARDNGPSGLVGNLDMALSYVIPSINYLESRR